MNFKGIPLKRVLVRMYNVISKKKKKVQITTHPNTFSYKTTENISCLVRNRHHMAFFKMFPY